MLRLYIVWAAVIAGLYTWGTMPQQIRTDVNRLLKTDRLTADNSSSFSKARWSMMPYSDNVEDRRGE